MRMYGIQKKVNLALGKAHRTESSLNMSTPRGVQSTESLTPGFQNNSANTTKSADEKVRPMLAAVMDSTATACLSDSWNCWHRSSLSADGVDPSMRIWGTCCRDRVETNMGC